MLRLIMTCYVLLLMIFSLFCCLVTHAHHLKEMESPVSLISCTLTNDSHQYYCVGTAFVHPEEAEPKSGRLILFLLDEGILPLY